LYYISKKISLVYMYIFCFNTIYKNSENISKIGIHYIKYKYILLHIESFNKFKKKYK